MTALPSIPGIELLHSLGSGAFGSVYRGRWRDDMLPTAVKVLHSPCADTLARFQREANLLKALRDSPHVVDVHAWDMDGTPPWISMELCEGSLASWCPPQHRPDARSILVAIAHAASGLADLHAEGGFHRDIKPANLLIARAENGAPTIKIGDFGLARSPLVDDSTLTRLGHGTPAFIAPELQRYANAAGPACDIYSLGVTCLFLLTGTTELDRIASIRMYGLEALLLRMVALDPRNRPSSNDVLSELQVIIEKAKVQAASPPKHKPKGMGNGEALAGILLGALFVGGAIAIGAAMRDDS